MNDAEGDGHHLI